MPQTILAVLAMMMATLFAMQQHRQALHAQTTMIKNELAVQGTGVAEDVLSLIGSMPFDEHTREEDAKVTSASGLSSVSAFGPNRDSPETNDIDDFHASTNINAEYRSRTIGADTLWFGVKIRIAYADPDAPEEEVTTGPTKAKKATVRVHSLAVENPDTIVVSRTYLCGSKCAWDDSN